MRDASLNRLGYLDGLRGLAAAWVIIGHAMILGQWKVPLLSSPEYAVDLFMLLSGFLMCHHRYMREAREPFQNKNTWLIFWIRRLFRIAPLYYCVLAAALLLGPYLGECRDQIAEVFSTTATRSERYTDQSLTNILSHISFLFGLSPEYHYRTALPDWSIGLEMQFYALFPFLVLMMARFGSLRSCCLLVAGCYALKKAAPEFFSAFEMPAFLLLKLNVFLAGMLIAEALHSTITRRAWYLLAAALVLVAIPLHTGYGIKIAAIRISCALTLGAFALQHLLPLPSFFAAMLSRLSSRLGRGIFYFLGEMSYGVYLVHLIIMLPVTAFITTHYGQSLSAPMRVLGCLLVVVPLTYGISWVLHIFVEKPGIALGRSIITTLKERTAMQPGS